MRPLRVSLQPRRSSLAVRLFRRGSLQYAHSGLFAMRGYSAGTTSVSCVDPTPILNPRVQDFVQAETDYRTTQGNTTDPVTGLPIPGGDQRITQDDAYRVTQQTGEPPHGLNTEPGTDPDAPGNDDPGLPYGNTEVPKTTLE
jgi:hypothetical protein